MAGTDFEGTVQSALIVMATFFGLGLVLGDLARRIVEESVIAELARLTNEDTKSEA